MISSEPSTRFERACKKLEIDATPIWLMRQAGRYMSEYRELRKKYDMLELIRTPELAAEVTMQPINAFDLDAAIIFADILPPLIGMGLDLEFVPGTGPIIHNPISSVADIEALAAPPTEENLNGTLEAIKLAVSELNSRNLPLIGFAGAPFTLACYAIEGSGSKVYAKAKSLMYSEPQAWKELMDKLVKVQADYLIKQAGAGAAALQVFDSWVGMALGKVEYIRYVQPYNTRLFEQLKTTGVPLINFSTGTSAYLEEVAICGGDVIGVDWRLPIGDAWARIGDGCAIQGNLDPTTLLTPWDVLKAQTDKVLESAAGRPGHIFNLGHGIIKTTPVDNVKRLVDYVHEKTSR